MPDGVAQVHHQGVEVIGEAAGGGGEPALVEVVDQRLQPLLGVGLADRLIERLPVGVLDALALAVGELWRRGCGLGEHSTAGGQTPASTARSP